MAGFVIHLAIAYKYLKNNKIENEDEFIEGILAPDLLKLSNIPDTHFATDSSKTNLYRFLTEKGVNSDYDRGYFLHLVTDYIFYNEYLTECPTTLYNDYDILNSRLIRKYKVNIPEKVAKFAKTKRGKLQVINKDTICGFIDSVGDIDLEEYAKQILKK